jgi:hypothetical protein
MTELIWQSLYDKVNMTELIWQSKYDAVNYDRVNMAELLWWSKYKQYLVNVNLQLIQNA